MTIKSIKPTNQTHPACGPIYNVVWNDGLHEQITLDELYNRLPDDVGIPYRSLLNNIQLIKQFDLSQ